MSKRERLAKCLRILEDDSMLVGINMFKGIDKDVDNKIDQFLNTDMNNDLELHLSFHNVINTVKYKLYILEQQ